jgi:ribosome-binding ATPase
VRVALVGLPASGKSTLFQLLTGTELSAAHRHEDQLGVVRVPDDRLTRLSALFQAKKTTPLAHEVVDPAFAFPDPGGPESRAGQDPYTVLRAADVLVAVLRAFDDPAVPHPAGSVDPGRDRERLEQELALADLVLVDTRLERIAKLEKVGKKAELPGEKARLGRLHAALDEGRPLRTLELSRDEEKAIRGYGFLSHKPLLAVHNCAAGAEGAAALPPAAHGFAALALALRDELEVARLPAEERPAFREALGLGEPAFAAAVAALHRLLGLVTFFTAGPPEARAWQVGPGEDVVEAAGKIHTDLARGFIRAEVLGWERLLEAGSWGHARERGWMRTEGRGYAVAEGDVLHVLFKV